MALLAIRTNAYARAKWCRTEVLYAKAGGSPLVVLDALVDVEPRAFPYLGNAPTVRWGGDASALSMERMLCVVLREALRFRHFPKRVSDLCRVYELPEDDRVLAAPPELLTVLRARAAADAMATDMDCLPRSAARNGGTRSSTSSHPSSRRSPPPR